MQDMQEYIHIFVKVGKIRTYDEKVGKGLYLDFPRKSRLIFGKVCNRFVHYKSF